MKTAPIHSAHRIAEIPELARKALSEAAHNGYKPEGFRVAQNEKGLKGKKGGIPNRKFYKK